MKILLVCALLVSAVYGKSLYGMEGGDIIQQFKDVYGEDAYRNFKATLEEFVVTGPYQYPEATTDFTTDMMTTTDVEETTGTEVMETTTDGDYVPEETTTGTGYDEETTTSFDETTATEAEYTTTDDNSYDAETTTYMFNFPW